MFVGHSSLHALYDGWDWGHGARSCLLLSYGANMCFTFATGFFFLLCTLTVPLRHHRSTSTALLSFVRKTNHQLHYIVFSMCFSSINGLRSFVTNGCKSAFDAYKGKAAAKPKCRVPIRCVYHLLRDGCGSSMIHQASFDYPLQFIMRTVGGISAMLVIHWHGACANSDINETSSTVLKG